MAAVWARLRSDLRTTWKALVALALLVGLFGAVVLAAAAGARRTATAYPRLLLATHASDVFISPFQQLLRGSYEEIRHLPGVVDSGLAVVPIMADAASSGTPNFLIFPTASEDGRYGYQINRPKILHGRLPAPGDPSEALIDTVTARKLHVGIGDRVTLLAFDGPPSDDQNLAPGEGRPATFRVVGIGAFPDRVVPTQIVDTFPQLLLSPAAYAEYASSPSAVVYEEIFLRLRPGTDLAALRSDVDRITGGDPGAGGSDFNLDADRTVKVERAIRSDAVALGLFAAIAAIGAVLVIGQTLSRQIFLDSIEYPTLRALGMTRLQLVAGIGVRSLGVGLVGAGVAVTLAVAASPLMPIGPARVAEPHPGVAVNAALLAAGALLIVVAVLAVAAVPAWRAASHPADVLGTAQLPGVIRPSPLAGYLVRVGAPPTVVAGVRLATERGHGRTAAPVRSTLGAVALAVVAVVASLTFGDNLGALVSRPADYGQQWDAIIDGAFVRLPTDSAVARLRGDPAIAAFSAGNYGEVLLKGHHTPAVGIDPLQGSVFPTLLRGRPPSGPDEIVLGAKEFRRAHRSIGQSVDVGIGGGTRTMRIVGEAVFPGMGIPSFDQTSLGEGAAVVGNVLPPTSARARSPDDIYNFFLVRFRPGASPAERQRLEVDTHRRGPFGDSCEANAQSACLFSTERPADVVNYRRVRTTPTALAALLAALGTATLVHGVVTGVRRRRRDFAILRVLGFVRGQVAAAVAWQATTVGILALVIGVPLGVLAGRWAWILFACQLGVRPAPDVPVVALLVVGISAVLLANLVALIPARAAARIGAAEVLREQ